MKVLFVTDRISLRGGADLHLRQVIAAVAESHDVFVAHGGRHAGAAVPEVAGGEMRLRCLAAAKRDERQLGRLADLVANADVVHLHNVMNPAAIETAVGSGRAIATIQDHRVFCPGRGKWTAGDDPDPVVCRQPMSATRCATCFDDEAYAEAIYELTAARRDALQGARRLVVLSDYMAGELQAAGLADARVIPPWVDVGGSPIVGDPLLIAGRLVSHKAATAACRAWRRSGVSRELLVAGDGPLAPEIAASGATLLGWLSPQRLRERLRGALALLLPSGWEEPFGIVGVEALAEGTPVILMRAGGTPDWSDRGCIVVPAGDVDAMAEAISRLAADTTLAKELGQQGQEMVKQRFDREVLLPRLLKLYDDIASREPGQLHGQDR